MSKKAIIILALATLGTGLATRADEPQTQGSASSDCPLCAALPEDAKKAEDTVWREAPKDRDQVTSSNSLKLKLNSDHMRFSGYDSRYDGGSVSAEFEHNRLSIHGEDIGQFNFNGEFGRGSLSLTPGANSTMGSSPGTGYGSTDPSPISYSYPTSRLSVNAGYGKGKIWQPGLLGCRGYVMGRATGEIYHSNDLLDKDSAALGGEAGCIFSAFGGNLQSAATLGAAIVNRPMGLTPGLATGLKASFENDLLKASAFTGREADTGHHGVEVDAKVMKVGSVPLTVGVAFDRRESSSGSDKLYGLPDGMVTSKNSYSLTFGAVGF